MLSIANVSSAAAASNYYEKDNYYAKDDPEHKQNSEWYGKGAEKLDLEGQVKKEDFQNVLKGKLPNGETLGRKENNEIVHASGIDLTFSAPKSVSIKAEVMQDKNMYEAHKKAVLKALNYAEKNLIETRKMINGEIVLEKAPNITAALFQHDVSRNLDPQLHTHCVLSNVVERDDKKWRSAHFGKIFENKLLLGQIYRSELAYELAKKGYELVITGKHSLFELKEIPDSLIRDFSSRSKEIAKAGESYENLNARIKAELTLRTRNYKKEVTNELLTARWQLILEEHDKAKQPTKVVQISDSNNSDPTLKNYIQNKWEAFCKKFDLYYLQSNRHIDRDIPARHSQKSVETLALDYAISHLSERQSVWEESDLLKHSLSYSLGKANLEKIAKELQNYKDNGTLLIAQQKLAAFENPLTTKTTLLREHETISLMKLGKGAVSPIISLTKIEQSLKETTVNLGQKEAISLILNSKDRVIGIQGVAGAGKTFMLQHAHFLFKEQGYTMRGLAPSASASNTLESEAGIKSETIHKFLFRYDGLIHGRGTEAGKQKMRADLANTIVVVDEASLSSTGQINALLKLSIELDFRIVLVGDSKQLNAVEAGKPFEQLQNAGMQTAVMDDIIRQKNIALKSAVYDSIQGDIVSAMDKLGDNIIEPTIKLVDTENGKQLLANLAAHEWLRLSDKDRNETLLTAPSHKIRETINAEIRNQLIFEGKLKGEPIIFKALESKGLTIAEMCQSKNYEAGNSVLFNRKYQTLGIDRGDCLLVESVKNNSVILKKEDGKLIEWQPSKLINEKRANHEIFENRQFLVQAGEQLRWTRNSSDNKEIINSKNISFVESKENKYIFKDNDGKFLVLQHNDTNLKHLEYAYASTVHAAQGKTYTNVIGVMESTHPNLTTQKSFYVTLSRAKFNATLITDDKGKLTSTLRAQTGERVSATEHQTFKKIQKENQPLSQNLNSKKSYKTLAAKPLLNRRYRETHTIKEIYNQLYKKLPEILPQFGFRSHNGYYISTSESKVDGSIGKKGKVYVYANNPGVLVDYTRGNKSIWDYIKDNYMPAASKSEMMQYLTDISGLSHSGLNTPLKDNLNISPQSKPIVLPQIVQVDLKLMGSINNYATDTLYNNPKAIKVLNYLKNERGYDFDTIKSMGLGCIDSKKALGKYLKVSGFSDEKIKEAYKTLHYIGQSHNLVIPYQNAKGEIIGFAARNINYQETDKIGKYLYTKGLSLSDSLLNIQSLSSNKEKEVILVEGMFDALHAKAKGINNVVALGGTAFNQRQLMTLHEYGIKSISLCLDNDKAGQEATTRIKEVISKSNLTLNIKDISLPHNIKDPDQMIKERGIDSFNKLISTSQPINSIQSNLTSTLTSKNDIIRSNENNRSIDLEI